MKSGKKLCAIILIATMIIGSGVFANATDTVNVDTNSLQETVSNLEKGYSEHYDIFGIEITQCSSHEVNGIIENTYLLDMKVVLKAGSVEEMDYYQGITEYCKATKANISQQKSADNLLRMDMLSSEQLDIYQDLKEYIGKEESLIFYVKRDISNK